MPQTALIDARSICCRIVVIALFSGTLSGCTTTVLMARCESWENTGLGKKDTNIYIDITTNRCGAKCGCVINGDFVDCESGERNECFKKCIGHWDLECIKWVAVRTPVDFITGAPRIVKDATPARFAFDPRTDVPLSSLITSNTVTVTGINSPVQISIAGGEYSVNNDVFTAGPANVKSGDAVVVRLTSSDSFSSTRNAILTVGTLRGTFSVTTLAADIVPDPFAFDPISDVALHTVKTSNVVTVNGIDVPVPISISGGEYSINGKNFTSDPGKVKNGDVVAVRQTSSDYYATTTNAILIIGRVKGIFSITTTDESFSPYNIIFSAAVRSAPHLTNETVDIEVTEGEETTFSASGAISGEGARKIEKRVIIRTGGNAGWGYEISKYSLVGYTGSGYDIINTKEWRGVTTGDIHSVRRKTPDHNVFALDITGVNDVETSGTIAYGEVVTKGGTSRIVENVELVIYDGTVWSGTASGHYRGPIELTSTLLYLPSFDVAFGRALYVQSNAHDGAIHFLDLPSAGDRISMGPLEGSSSGLCRWVYTAPPQTGDTAVGFIEPVYHIEIISVPTGSHLAITFPQGISLIFSEITSAGEITLRERPDIAAPAGLTFMGTAHELSTSATFTGLVTVCFSYNEKALSCLPDKGVQLLKRDASSGSWSNITSSMDSAIPAICGSTDSLAVVSVCCSPL